MKVIETLHDRVITFHKDDAITEAELTLVFQSFGRDAEESVLLAHDFVTYFEELQHGFDATAAA